MKWWSETTDGLDTDVEEVIGNWEGAISYLEWEEVAQQNAYIQFGWYALPGTLAGATSYSDYCYAEDEGADYWTEAFVLLDNVDYDWTDVGTDFALAHELGHVYGLAERYYTDPISCNPDEDTVMQAAEVVNGTVVGCMSGDDLETPSAEDQERVNEFWSEGHMTFLTPVLNGSDITWTWKDYVWAEQRQDVQMFHSSESGWVYYYGEYWMDDIGVHNEYNDRTIEWVMDPSDYGYEGPTGVWHCLCGYPYFEEADEHGSWTCESIYVP